LINAVKRVKLESMSFLLRLGCALLASVGIAAAHGAVAPADAVAHHPAQERLAAAPVEAPREEASAKTSPDSTVRQARRNDQAPRTTPATISRDLAAPTFSFIGLTSLDSSRAVPSFISIAASPRGPPASV
jgi:hypothetical protein